MKKTHSEYHRKSRYGISQEDYDQIYSQQHGRCAICGTSEPVGRGKCFHVDHNHDTDEVRGLLCHRCNVLLGMAGDDIDTLVSAIAYLRDRGSYAYLT